MSDSPIISVQVDDSEFNRFLERFDGYQKSAATSPDPFARAASSLHEAGEALSGLSTEFSSLATSAGSSAMSGPNSFISKWTKGSHQAAADWAATSKSISTSRRDLISFDRVWRNVKSVGKDASIIGGVAAAGFATAIRAADNLAKKNLEARATGVPIGRLDALENSYSPLGLNRSDVSRFADAKDDLSLQLPLRAAGISGDDIQNKSADELTIESFEKMSKQFGEWEKLGANAKRLMETFGFDKFFSIQQLRAGAGFGPQKLSDTHVRFEADADRMSIDQGTADDATAFRQRWEADLRTVGNAFDAEIGRASPELGRLADAASSAGLSLIRWFGPRVAKLANQTGDVIDDLNNGPKAPPVDGQYDHTLEGGLRKFGDGIRSMFPGIPDTTTGTIAPSLPQLKVDPRVGLDTLNAYANLSRAAEQKYHLPAGLQSLQMSEESRFQKNAENPLTHARGLLQFMPSTAAQMNIDPTNPEQSIDAGGRLLRSLIDANGGNLAKALAAFDGDTHIDADGKRFKSWLQGAKSETLNYLRPFADAGYDLGLNADELAFLRAHSRQFNAATNDANLKVGTDASLASGESVVDATTSKQDSISLKKHIEDAVRTKRMAMEETANNFLRILHEGGLASLANNNAYGPSKTAQHQGNRAPVLIDVKVSSPAGSSTSVSMNSIPK